MHKKSQRMVFIRTKGDRQNMCSWIGCEFVFKEVSGEVS